MTYFFDIGANNGSDSMHWLNHHIDKGGIVYAFEPTPQLCEKIKTQIQERKWQDRYLVIQKAVSHFNGTAPFYVSGQADWGCSSLDQFQDSIELEKTWPGRQDFKVTDTIQVEVIRLDQFIEDEKLLAKDPNFRIDYLHVDAQGEDLNVLKSLGKYLTLVKEGVIEMPSSHQQKLYKDQLYVMEDAVNFLKENGFIIDKIESNDTQTNEVNIYFHASSSS
jgi:FkbM family methyltransferase